MDNPLEIPLSDNSREVAKWIWQNLVPKSGQCETVQGELLRAVEKLSWEAQNNGNVNWDSGFETLIDFLEGTLCDTSGIDDELKRSVREDLNALRDYEYPQTEDAVYGRLTAAVVTFCQLHPRLIPKPLNPKLHR
jgi:hypothetical protein